MTTRLGSLPAPQRTVVMGIVNTTTDSFSDGGAYLDTQAALAHSERLLAAGADIIDVGGESTRPGATRVSAAEELQRVVPVIRELSRQGIATSVDTMRAQVAAAAVAAGAAMINDVSGGAADPQMRQVMAQTAVPVCLMHWETTVFGDAAGAAHSAAETRHHTTVVADVRTRLEQLIDAAVTAGVREDNIIVDPGLGFAKTAEDNWALLAALPQLVAAGYPVLIGASRKRFLSALRAERGLESSPTAADPATAALSALVAHTGVWGVRVHDVAASRDAVEVAAAWRRGGEEHR